jgi:hypothetical protein
MDQKFAVLSKGPNFVSEKGYNTLHQAREDGALVLAYGCVLFIPTRDAEWNSPSIGFVFFSHIIELLLRLL